MARRKALELTMISSGEFLQVFSTIFVRGCGMERHDISLYSHPNAIMYISDSTVLLES
jgi:hypothetical protein